MYRSKRNKARAQRRATGVLIFIIIALLAVLLCEAFLLIKAKPGATPATNSVTTEEVQFSAPRGEGSVNLHATVTLPGSDNAPLVVMCHGFTGNRRGDGHFAVVAQQLAERGIASIAVDFPGNGESEEPFTAYTLDNMRSDIDAAIQYMQQNHATAADKIGLLGHSMGGRVASLRLGEDIAAAALWSPADNVGIDGLEFLYAGDEDIPARLAELQTMAAQGGALEFPRWGVTISADFVNQMAASDPWAAIQNYHSPLLVAFAAGDPDLLSGQTIDGTLAAAAARGQDFVDLSGAFTDATHNYTAMTGDAAADADIRSRIEQQTVDFFVSTLYGE